LVSLPRRHLARNTVYNLLGQGLPVLAAVICVPWLISSLGTERFGLLSLVWVLVGYFGLLDLGLGPALTQLVAVKLGEGKSHEVPEVIWTSLCFLAMLSIVGVVLVVVLSRWLVYDTFNILPSLQRETLLSFYVLACSLPFVTSTAALRGILEAHQRFDMVNVLRIPMGLLMYVSPLLVSIFSNSLPVIIAALVVVRILAWSVHLVFCLHTVPALMTTRVVKIAILARLLHFGSWMTLANLLAPVLVTMDRYFVGALMSLSAVSYYASPQDVVMKIGIIPGALLGVLFPAFASTYRTDSQFASALFSKAVRFISLTMFPLLTVAIVFGHELLNIWLGPEFARQSASVVRWLALGVLVNSLGQVPFTALLGAGRSDLIAKLFLLEVPFYLVGVWYLISVLGLEGAAMAWVLRITADTVMLFFLIWRLLPGVASAMWSALLTVAVVLIIFSATNFPMSVLAKSLFEIASLCVFGRIAWFKILTVSERQWVQRCAGALRGYP